MVVRTCGRHRTLVICPAIPAALEPRACFPPPTVTACLCASVPPLHTHVSEQNPKLGNQLPPAINRLAFDLRRFTRLGVCSCDAKRQEQFDQHGGE
ncbi:unnamed protein product [Closterium sp. Naga37s-1]|nr:unnamed protein product [Closterium sp. Naga37s-1]